jgi:putative hydrolase of HD superfamily
MKKKKIVRLNSKTQKLINFLFETRILKYLPRASLPYLKTPLKENVAEHSFYTTIIAWILAEMERVDKDKAIKMALIHDLAEARGGERNLINKFYSQPINEPKIVEEICRDYGLKNFEILELFEEFFEEKTKEAKVVKDADILAGMLLEKESFDTGNKKARKWLIFSLARLKTKSGKELGRSLIKTDSDSWWLKIVKKYLLFTKFL